jgi:hypothetical protein
MGDITNDRANRDHQRPAYSWWERTLARIVAPDSAIHLMPKRKWDWNDHEGLIVFSCLIGGIGVLSIFAFIIDFLDQNGLLQSIIEYCNAFGAFVALYKTVIVGAIVAGVGGTVAVWVLFTERSRTIATRCRHGSAP